MRRIALILWILTGFLMPPGAALGAGTVSGLEYSRDPGVLLLSLTEIAPELADQDPTPGLRVYGDGRVVVYRPAYLKRAGSRELYLSATELEALMREATAALTRFSPESVRLQKREADIRRVRAASELSEVRLFHTADAPVTRFYLRVDAYRPAGFSQSIRPGKPLWLEWPNLREDARRYPGLRDLQALDRLRQRLRNMAANPALRPARTVR